MADEYKTEADFTYQRYEQQRELQPERDIPEDDLQVVNTITSQSISKEPEASDVEFYIRSDMSPNLGTGTGSTSTEIDSSSKFVEMNDEEQELEDIPDADDIQEDSPVDASAPVEDMHGTDLINGFNGEDPEEL